MTTRNYNFYEFSKERLPRQRDDSDYRWIYEDCTIQFRIRHRKTLKYLGYPIPETLYLNTAINRKAKKYFLKTLVRMSKEQWELFHMQNIIGGRT